MQNGTHLLWCTKNLYDLKRGDYSFEGRQFNSNPARQLLLVWDLTWLDASLLDGFVDEAVDILSQNARVGGQASLYPRGAGVARTQNRDYQRGAGAVAFGFGKCSHV